jgi:hypothetical protein
MKVSAVIPRDFIPTVCRFKIRGKRENAYWCMVIANNYVDTSKYHCWNNKIENQNSQNSSKTKTLRTVLKSNRSKVWRYQLDTVLSVLLLDTVLSVLLLDTVLSVLLLDTVLSVLLLDTVLSVLLLVTVLSVLLFVIVLFVLFFYKRCYLLF